MPTKEIIPVPAVATATEDLASCMERGDTIIDGGNSCYRDDLARPAGLSGKGLHLGGCGTSGGVWGIKRGYCLMVGGDAGVADRPRPVFATIATGMGARQRHRALAAGPDATALFRSPSLHAFTGRISDSGEGRWTSVASSLRSSPPRCIPVSTPAALAISPARPCPLCKGFGGHDEKKA